MIVKSSRTFIWGSTKHPSSNMTVISSASLSPAATSDPALRQEVGQLGETLTSTRNTLAEVLTKMDILESQGTVAGEM